MALAAEAASEKGQTTFAGLSSSSSDRLSVVVLDWPNKRHRQDVECYYLGDDDRRYDPNHDYDDRRDDAADVEDHRRPSATSTTFKFKPSQPPSPPRRGHMADTKSSSPQSALDNKQSSTPHNRFKKIWWPRRILAGRKNHKTKHDKDQVVMTEQDLTKYISSQDEVDWSAAGDVFRPSPYLFANHAHQNATSYENRNHHHHHNYSSFLQPLVTVFIDDHREDASDDGVSAISDEFQYQQQQYYGDVECVLPNVLFIDEEKMEQPPNHSHGRHHHWHTLFPSYANDWLVRSPKEEEDRSEQVDDGGGPYPSVDVREPAIESEGEVPVASTNFVERGVPQKVKEGDGKDVEEKMEGKTETPEIEDEEDLSSAEMIEVQLTGKKKRKKTPPTIHDKKESNQRLSKPSMISEDDDQAMHEQEIARDGGIEDKKQQIPQIAGAVDEGAPTNSTEDISRCNSKKSDSNSNETSQKRDPGFFRSRRRGSVTKYNFPNDTGPAEREKVKPTFFGMPVAGPSTSDYGRSEKTKKLKSESSVSSLWTGPSHFADAGGEGTVATKTAGSSSFGAASVLSTVWARLIEIPSKIFRRHTNDKDDPGKEDRSVTISAVADDGDNYSCAAISLDAFDGWTSTGEIGSLLGSSHGSTNMESWKPDSWLNGPLELATSVATELGARSTIIIEDLESSSAVFVDIPCGVKNTIGDKFAHHDSADGDSFTSATTVVPTNPEESLNDCAPCSAISTPEALESVDDENSCSSPTAVVVVDSRKGSDDANSRSTIFATGIAKDSRGCSDDASSCSSATTVVMVDTHGNRELVASIVKDIEDDHIFEDLEDAISSFDSPFERAETSDDSLDWSDIDWNSNTEPETKQSQETSLTSTTSTNVTCTHEELDQLELMLSGSGSVCDHISAGEEPSSPAAHEKKDVDTDTKHPAGDESKIIVNNIDSDREVTNWMLYDLLEDGEGDY